MKLFLLAFAVAGTLSMSCKSALQTNDDRQVSSYKSSNAALDTQMNAKSQSKQEETSIVTPKNITGIYLACLEGFDDEHPNDLKCRLEKNGSFVKLDSDLDKNKSWLLTPSSLEFNGNIQVKDSVEFVDWDVIFTVNLQENIMNYASTSGMVVAIDILLDSGNIRIESELSDAFAAREGRLLPDNRTRVKGPKYSSN